MKLYPHFVSGGVYLRTETGELIGRLDEPGEPFETLEEAREKADWLDLVLQFQQSRPEQPFGHVAAASRGSTRTRVRESCT